MAIPASRPLLGNEEKRAVMEVLNSGMLAQGPKVGEFEKAFAKYCGTRFAVAVNNGTTALHCALLAAGIGKGDEVLTTPFTFIASANAVVYCGGKPVFVDVGEDYNIDAGKLEAAVTGNTKAILPVHLYGYPCDMKTVREVAERHGLKVVEDACQAHGAEFFGRKAGALGNAGCFSFYATKNMTTGEGGMVTTDDEEIAEKCRLLRAHGSKKRYYHEEVGYNYRMTEIAAAIGVEQLKKLDGFNKERIANAKSLNESLSGVGGIVTPKTAPGRKHVFHQYTVRITEGFGMARDGVAAALAKAGIGTGLYYPLIVPKQEAYAKLGLSKGSWPVAERMAGEVLSLPVNPSLGDAEVDEVARALAALKR